MLLMLDQELNWVVVLGLPVVDLVIQGSVVDRAALVHLVVVVAVLVGRVMGVQVVGSEDRALDGPAALVTLVQTGQAGSVQVGQVGLVQTGQVGLVQNGQVGSVQAGQVGLVQTGQVVGLGQVDSAVSGLAVLVVVGLVVLEKTKISNLFAG